VSPVVPKISFLDFTYLRPVVQAPKKMVSAKFRPAWYKTPSEIPKKPFQKERTFGPTFAAWTPLCVGCLGTGETAHNRKEGAHES
jgi:hypothetical protein